MSQTNRQSILPDAPVQDASPDRAAGSGNVITSTALMNGRREILILHAGEHYRLRITANDKLILTK